jgi:hypothetical protein
MFLLDMLLGNTLAQDSGTTANRDALRYSISAKIALVNALGLEADLNDTLASQLVYTHVEIISSAGASQVAS